MPILKSLLKCLRLKKNHSEKLSADNPNISRAESLSIGTLFHQKLSGINSVQSRGALNLQAPGYAVISNTQASNT